MRRILLVAAVALLAVPAAAPASVVRVEDSTQTFFGPYSTLAGNEAVHYVADPGEANRLLVTYDSGAVTVTVHDDGALVRAGESCRSVDEHTAVCVSRPGSNQPYLQHAEAVLGDGDDELRTYRPPPNVIGGIAAWGGPGDDLLDGGDGPDTLDGGGGRDVVLGGGGPDVVTDGDRSGAPGSAGPGPDVLDGGAGRDLVSYAQRHAGVFVDLGSEYTAGEPSTFDVVRRQGPAEGDVLRGVEDVMGGAGDDELHADEGPNWVAAGLGDDVVTGEGGGPPRQREGDRLEGEGGNDAIAGGDGPDSIAGGPGRDTLSCDDGSDSVAEPAAGEVLGPDCEQIGFYDPYGRSREGGLAFAPHPSFRARDRLAFGIGCPSFEEDDGEFRPCGGTLTAREAAGAHRLLGRAPVRRRRESEAAVPVRLGLTALGRRRARERNGVLTTLTLNGTGFPRLQWTIRVTTR
ncbi:MAG TPA: hypothetical protein VF549_13180 [Solirubrobacteraceae bacterium]|jgi:Ca2+-binding RTX toxin-like protein